MTRRFFRDCGAVQFFCALCAGIGCFQFLLQTLLPRLGARGFLFCTQPGELALSGAGLAGGALWQPLTYAAFHGNFTHLTLNVVALLITGGALEEHLGRGRMKWLLLFGIVGGAIGFLLSVAVDPRLPENLQCIGASAAVTACLGAVTALVPREKVTLWVAVVPLPVRAIWLLPIAVGLFVCEAIGFVETTSYGAHIGGYLAGMAFVWGLRRGAQ